MTSKNYYKILQVDPSAEPEVIDAAFRRLARKYHPDVNKAPDAVTRMKDLNEARDILMDPLKRAIYDRERSSSKSKTSPQTRTRSHEYHDKHQRSPSISKTFSTQRGSIVRAWFLPIGLVLLFLYIFAITIYWNETSDSNLTRTPEPIRQVNIATSVLSENPWTYRTITEMEVHPDISICTHWSEITLDEVLEYLCVYGVVDEVEVYDQGYNENPFFIWFGDDRGEFLIRTQNLYEQVQKGTCVVAEGLIGKYKSSPMIFIKLDNHLRKCNSNQK